MKKCHFNKHAVHKGLVSLIALLAVSIAFLACNANDVSGKMSGSNPSGAYTPEMICTDDIPEMCYPIDNPSVKPEPPGLTDPYKPSPAIITKDVENWMKEQLESQSGEKRLILISDMHIPETIPRTLSAISYSDKENGSFVEYFYNGNKISEAEYYRIQEEYHRQVKCRRELSIPGEIISGEFNCITWTVLMTAEELAELLSKQYYELAIGFYIEPQND